MRRERCHLTNHALLDAIPLRMGRTLEGAKLYLESVEPDPDGTANQKRGEIERGNEHAVAGLWTSSEGGENLGRWRLVLGRAKESFHDRPIVTVLPEDRQQAKSQSEVTSLLKKERESGRHAWLTPEYVACALHPLYREGRLSSPADLSEHIREKDKEPLVARLKVADERINEVLAENDQLKVAVEALRQRSGAQGRQDVALEVATPARQVTDVWRSQTVDSEYTNVGIEAQIIDVTAVGSNVFLTYLDANGKPKKVYDFGYRGLVHEVFDYLKAHKGRRAVFILTFRPDKIMRLASDTMMLSRYRQLWKVKERPSVVTRD